MQETLLGDLVPAVKWGGGGGQFPLLASRTLPAWHSHWQLGGSAPLPRARSTWLTFVQAPGIGRFARCTRTQSPRGRLLVQTAPLSYSSFSSCQESGTAVSTLEKGSHSFLQQSYTTVRKCTRDCVVIRWSKMTKMTALKEEPFYSRFPRGIPRQQGPVEKSRVPRKLAQGRAWARGFVVVFTGRNGQGKVSSLGLRSLRNPCRLQAINNAVPSWYGPWGDVEQE